MRKNLSSIGIGPMLRRVKRVLISGIGGGGDILTALHVKWALKKVAPHIQWLHGGITGANINYFKEIIKIDANSAWITEDSHSPPPHRLIESVIASYLKENIFLLSCYNGVQSMVSSLNQLIELKKIEMTIFIDGGTDSLTFKGSRVLSPVEDTMGLATVGLGEYSNILKYRVAGVSVVGSDGEMTLEEIGYQLLKIFENGGYLGGTFFPVERLSEYAKITADVLKKYPTATALAPLLLTKTPFEWGPYPPYSPIVNGFQLATFLFDARIAAEVGNDFTSLIFKSPSHQAAKQAISKALESSRITT